MIANNKAYVFINGKKFFIKKDRYHNKYEIIVEKLANIAGVNCAKYHYSVKSNSYLSEDLNFLGDFKTAKELGLSIFENHLYKIWDFFEEKYPKESSKLMKEFIKVYLFNFFIVNPDLHSGNWGIVTNNDGTHSVYIFDNEYSFDDENCTCLTAELDDDFGYINCDILKNNIKELEYFLSVSSRESIELFINMFLKLTPDVFKMVILETGEDYGLSKNKINSLNRYYTTNYKLIKDALKKFDLVDDFSLK